MLVAVLVTGFNKFFMGGAAYPCLLGVIFLAIILTGPMAYSIDALLGKRTKAQKLNLRYSTAF